MNKLLRARNKRVYGSLRQLSTTYVNPALCWPRPDYGPTDVCRSEFMNGLKVAAAKPLGNQMAACTIMFQAGSRLESDVQLGATHFIRAATTGNGTGFSGFMRIRSFQERGAYVTCSSDRQSIAFTMRCPQPEFNDLYCHFIDIAARCVYREIDLKDKVRPLVRDDLSRRPQEQHVLDLVQQACWGGPLSNSVYCAPGRVDAITQESLEEFTRLYFTTNLCTIGSVGLPFEDVLKLAEHIECGVVERPQNPCQPMSFPRAGFETCDLGRGSETWIAVAVPGCGTWNLDCLLRHSILASALGTDMIMSGTHRYNHIPQSPLGLMARECFTEFKAFNISYYDNGMFGIVAKTRAETAEYAALCAVEFLTKIHEVTCQQVEIGKKRLKLCLALHEEDPVKVSEGLALQLASNHCIDGPRSSIQMVDNISPDQVMCVAQELCAKRHLMAVAIVGDVPAVSDTGTLMCHNR